MVKIVVILLETWFRIC